MSRPVAVPHAFSAHLEESLNASIVRHTDCIQSLTRVLAEIPFGERAPSMPQTFIIAGVPGMRAGNDNENLLRVDRRKVPRQRNERLDHIPVVVQREGKAAR